MPRGDLQSRARRSLSRLLPYLPTMWATGPIFWALQAPVMKFNDLDRMRCPFRCPAPEGVSGSRFLSLLPVHPRSQQLAKHATMARAG